MASASFRRHYDATALPITNDLRVLQLPLDSPMCIESFRFGAVIGIARETFNSAEHDAAYACFRDIFKRESRPLQSRAAIEWCKLSHEPDQIEKLLVLTLGLLADPESTAVLHELVEVCYKNGWNDLLIYFARRAGTRTGTAANDLGRAYEQLNLPSLAYLAFSESVDLGITVAKVNMARGTKSGPVPAVGLKLLRDHTGGYDAADAGYPYAVRAELERLVQQEDEKAALRETWGERLFTSLGSFAWEAIRGSEQIEGCFDFGGDSGMFSTSNQSLLLGALKETRQLNVVGKTIPVVVAEDGNSTYLFTSRDDRTLVELKCNLIDGSELPKTEVRLEMPKHISGTGRGDTQGLDETMEATGDATIES